MTYLKLSSYMKIFQILINVITYIWHGSDFHYLIFKLHTSHSFWWKHCWMAGWKFNPSILNMMLCAKTTAHLTKTNTKASIVMCFTLIWRSFHELLSFIAVLESNLCLNKPFFLTFKWLQNSSCKCICKFTNTTYIHYIYTKCKSILERYNFYANPLQILCCREKQ